MPNRNMDPRLNPLRPGSPEAKQAGCICRAQDNSQGSLGVWIAADCPLHGPPYSLKKPKG